MGTTSSFPSVSFSPSRANNRSLRGSPMNITRQTDARPQRTSHGTRLRFLLYFAATTLILLFIPLRADALTPRGLLVIANDGVPESVSLARYYMKKRNIPPENLLLLRTASAEQISRTEYDREIATPVREYLASHDPDGKRLACLVLIYGVPLRVLPRPMTDEEEKHREALKKRAEEVARELKGLSKGEEERRKLLQEGEAALLRKIRETDHSEEGAAVDSELALVMEKPYDLRGWLPNRYFLGFRDKKIDGMPKRVILVSRLDGPSEAVVRRIIDDSIAAEQDGLKGIAYFDARWPERKEKDPSPYTAYDRAIHNAARIVKASGIMPVVLDERETVLQPGEAPNAALYLGWYSLGKYVDAFTWAKGAVGFHVASTECATLRNRASTVWCKMMLEKGVAATLGPVAEPYLHAFPAPEIFFACLVGGRLARAECYALANPFWSWQMVLIGDPLYRPFAMKSLQENQITSGNLLKQLPGAKSGLSRNK